MASDLSLETIKVAITQIGQEESPIGSNWGYPVSEYLASVGIDFPASWCMAFVYWCFNYAASNIGTVNPLVKTGGVLKAYNSAVSHHQSSPQEGDIFIMDLGHGLGHCGIVELIDGSNIHTIDGNTNDTGSREGYAVERKIRAKSTIKGYLRY